MSLLKCVREGGKRKGHADGSLALEIQEYHLTFSGVIKPWTKSFLQQAKKC